MLSGYACQRGGACRSEHESDVPSVPYRLTRHDVLLLYALMIDPEQSWLPHAV